MPASGRTATLEYPLMPDLARTRRTFIDGPYGQVHCRIAAAAMPANAAVVCLHMSPKSSLSYRELLPHLAVDRIAMAPDNPGHGESDLPPAHPEVSIADYAASAWAAIDALCDTPVHLVGYHTGSMVAVEAAQQRPQDVLSIVNLSAPILTPDEARTLNETYAPLPLDESGSRFTIMWQRVVDNLGPEVPLQVAAASFAENLRAVDDYEWGHRAAFSYAARYNELLGQLQHPYLLINPHDDCYELSKRAAGIVDNLRIVDYPAIGHGFISTDPGPLAAVINAFIREYDTRV